MQYSIVIEKAHLTETYYS